MNYYKFSMQVSKFFNSTKVDKYVELLEDVSSAVTPIYEHGFGLLTAAHAVGKIASGISQCMTFYSDDFWNSDDWDTVSFDDALFSTIKILVEHEYRFTIINTLNSDYHLKLFDINGCEFGWTETKTGEIYGQIYTRVGSLNQFEELVKTLIWSKFDTKNILVKEDNEITSNNKNISHKNIKFEIDSYIEPLPSEIATKYSIYFKKVINAGINRSLLLYGPPGTGKSTIARMIIKNLELRCIRFRTGDISSISESLLYDVVKLFKPEAIIFDDFDRSASFNMLEALEFLRNNVKLIVATANNRNSIDEALLRPKRFDEMDYVTSLDEAVIKKVLGDCHDAYELVKNWPIVFIEEYVTRRRFQSKEEVELSMSELAERVMRIDKNEVEQNDISKILNVLQKKEKLTNLLPVTT